MTLSAAQESEGSFRAVSVEVEGGLVPVHVVGSGASLLLVHGLSANHTQWTEVARRLAPDFRVLVPDLLGRGASRARPDAGFSLTDEAARLAGILDALESDGAPDAPGGAIARPLIVAGHSHGAALAVALAARIPVAGLALVSPVTPWTRRPAGLDLLRRPGILRVAEPVLRACRRPLTRYILTRRVYGANRPQIDRAVRRYAEPYAEPERARALLRVLRDWRPSELTDVRPPVGVPVRVLTGSDDRRIDPGQAGRWARALEGRFDVIEGAGHGITEEVPDRVAAVVRELAARIHGREGREHR